LNNIKGGADQLPHRHRYPNQEVSVDALSIFLASLGTAYLVARLNRRGSFDLADLAIGIFCGCAGLILAQLIGVEGAEWRPGLPLFLACGLTLGLESLPHRFPVR
jgi:hypothetical protein